MSESDKLVSLLEGMLVGAVDLVDGCRELSQLRNDGDERIPLLFVGFASELDRVPLARSRDLWSEQALAEAMKTLDSYRDSILTECRRLLMLLR